MARKLTIKQQRFADEYIISGNRTDAYKKAGYSWKTESGVNSNASNLLRNYKVKSYIDERLKELDNEKIAKQDEVLKYLTSVMRGETLSEVVVIEGLGEGVTNAIRMDKSPDEKDRLKAAELLGKRYKLFTDRLDMDSNVDMDLNIIVDYGDDK